MKTFSDILDINPDINVEINIETIEDNGYPNFEVKLNHQNIIIDQQKNIGIKKTVSVFDPIRIEIVLKDKKYSSTKETAILLRSIKIAGIDIVPKFLHLTEYNNDHNQKIHTTHIGYNGCWSLDTGKPFFEWYHEVSGQGMLIKP